jgi:signal transduction histidine kinase
MLVDGVLAFFLTLLSLGPVLKVGPAWQLPLVAATTIPVAFRRKYPLQAFVISGCALAVDLLVARGPGGVAILAVLILLYTLAAYRPRRVSVPGLLVSVVGALAVVAARAPHSIGAPDVILLAVVVSSGTAVVAWVLGDSMQYRRAYLKALEDRAARLERERGTQAQIAAAAERARIARELHDVIAHNVSVMVVQADGAGYALRTQPERAGQALAAIAQTGRQALAEMRRLLGVLRSGDEQAGLAPVPGLDQIRELIEQARDAGMSVSLTVFGAPRPLSEGAELAAYRVVQESLTNTRKHGGLAAAAAVTMSYEPDALLLQMTDDGLGAAAAPDGIGHGLTGMRERIEMYGGTVQAGPLPGGGYQVTARLPYAVAGTGEPARNGAAPAGDRAADRAGDRGADRAGDRGADRAGDRGADRAGDRAGSRSESTA